MIEIPESLTLAKQLNHTVKGKKIAEVEAEHTRHGFAWYNGDPLAYPSIMDGKQLGLARGMGSFVELELGEYRFTVNDGTNVRYYNQNTKWPERYQMRITFEEGDSLFYTVQMYGGMFLFKPEEYDNFYYKAAFQKPLPGTEEFDYDYFTALRDELPGNLSIKAFLATEQRIPGLGNGVLQDILLEAGFHPKHKIAGIREKEWKHIYDSVQKVLEQMVEKGGRDTEKDLFGNPGSYQTKLSKKTLNGPCPYCGSIIQKTSYLGGTVYFCTECQK